MFLPFISLYWVDMRSLIFISLLLFIVTGCASNTAKLYEPLVISDIDMQKLKSTNPISKKLAEVRFDRNKVEVCLWCLVYYQYRDILGKYWEKLFDKDFPALLKNVLYHSLIFDGHAKDSVMINAKLISFSDIGNGSSRKKLTVLYQLIDGDSIINSWTITSLGHANHFDGMDNEAESSHEAITQNILMFALLLIADTDSEKSQMVQQEIAALNQKMNTDNASTGNIVSLAINGAVAEVKNIGNAIGSGMSFVAENSGVIADAMNNKAATWDNEIAQLNAGTRGTTLEAERAKALRDAGFYDRVAKMEADSNSQLNRDKREQERERAENKRAAEEERATKYETTKKANQADRDTQGTIKELKQDEAGAVARKNREMEEQKLQRERETKRLVDERRKEELDRKRKAEALAAKQKAKAERKKAEKVRLAREEDQRKSNYLSNMESGINLKARFCPGGEGKHYIVGIRPRIKPEEVSCIDVYYTEICPGSVGSASGVIKNFLGAATDCFMGDTAEVSPTPSCKPDLARISVNRVKECGN